MGERGRRRGEERRGKKEKRAFGFKRCGNYSETGIIHQALIMKYLNPGKTAKGTPMR
jgi:hypothetical protein